MRFLFGTGIRWWNANVFYAASLADALKEDGHEVLFSARKGGKPYTGARKMGLPVADIDFDTQNPVKMFIQLIRLKSLIKEFSPDYVLAVTSKAQFLIALAKIFFFRRLKVIRILADVQSPKRNASNRWFYKHWIDYIIASSNSSRRNAIENVNYPPEKIKVIYLGYPVERFYKKFDSNRLRKRYGIPETAFLALNIGRLAETKDQFTLIEAAGILRKRGVDIFVLISGEELDFTIEQLSDSAEKSGVGKNTRIISRVEDVRELIAMGDVGVVTSVASEVVCRIATEYMIYGLPVIGTDVNVIPEMIEDGVNGFIFPRGNAEKLAEALERLINDSALREKISKNNHLKAERKFSYGYFGESFLNVVKSG